MVVGTLFYNLHEKLSLVNSFYLSGVTHPVTDVGKIFTVFYIFAGWG
jgi:hypothetical protein